MAENNNHDWKCDGEFADAPFCKGDSVVECWDGSQVPQHAICPSNPCEQAGTCDHTDPVPGSDCPVSERSARGYCDGDGHEAERCSVVDCTTESDAPTPAPTPTPGVTTNIETATTTAPAPELPVTGPEMVPSLLGASLAMLAIGTGILRKVRG